ncbi:hypothetical protein EYB53_013570 [Candidatus Chloroploca sp. M-50]|uniref:Uncharacterized protein n=1 Tax=Candidatus Chloroploca mongolica TaxID=2528176 RepID=A0ABS4DBR9_9CHLR|nr:hypothetical protein [Candidatus Chloroploca mongolica]MBP1466739.1 hypothetical protein [Candidatus Chloroploca mongolica]
MAIFPGRAHQGPFFVQNTYMLAQDFHQSLIQRKGSFPRARFGRLQDKDALALGVGDALQLTANP